MPLQAILLQSKYTWFNFQDTGNLYVPTSAAG